MSFKFQINPGLQFKNNETFLAKAEKNKPELFHKEIDQVRTVKLVKDPTKVANYSVKEIAVASDNFESSPMKEGEAIILDFGDHYVGQLALDLLATGSPMDAPLFIKFEFAEIAAELAMNATDYDGWLSRSWIQEEVFHLDVLPLRFKLPRRYSFRYVRITVLGTSPKWQLVVKNPVLHAESSVSFELEAEKKIADPLLQKIYNVSVKTLRDCMQDVFEDGPKRDRRLWLGDLRLQAIANYRTFKDVKLVKRCLYLFAAMTTEQGRISANVFVQPVPTPDDTFLLDYSLFFISTLSDYYEFSKDEKTLSELYPIAKVQLDLILQQVSESGEFHITEDYPVFVDWSNEFDKTTAGQAILIYTLKQFLTLTVLISENEGRPYQQKLTILEQYAKTKLFDPTKQLFFSGEQKEYTIASQIWMVLANVFSKEQNREIMQTAYNELFPITGIATPYMYHHITHALFEAGLTTEGTRLLKEYWGKMIELGADTFWEAFDPNQPDYSPYGSTMISSYCHAWSCTPAYLIDEYLIETKD